MRYTNNRLTKTTSIGFSDKIDSIELIKSKITNNALYAENIQKIQTKT